MKGKNAHFKSDSFMHKEEISSGMTNSFQIIGKIAKRVFN